MKSFLIIGISELMGNSFFSENLFLKNLYKFHHIVDKKGNIKSSRDFKRMGLDQSEIKEIK